MFDNIKEKLGKVDIWLFIPVFLLSLYGLLWVYSSSRSLPGGDKLVIVQFAAFIVGIIAMTVMANIDYEQYEGKINYIFIASISMLILTKFIGKGAEETGTQGWIRFFGIGIQPAEVIKIAFILTLSYHLNKVLEDVNIPGEILKLCGHFCIFALLILWQPDIGMVMVYGAIFIGMLYIAKVSYKYFLGFFGFLALSIPIAWYALSSESYIRGRVLTFFNPELDPTGSGYNVIQSKIAIGSGALFGRGFTKGVYNNMNWLPAKQTDFISGVIGEEWGFVGVMIALILLLVIILRCLYIAKESKNFLGGAIATGVSVMLIFHFFENMGMCIGVMPVTGIPLPFLSYGGSSLVTNFMAIGLVMSVYSRRKPINF